MRKVLFPLTKVMYKNMEMEVTDEQYERLEEGEDPEFVIEGFEEKVDKELEGDGDVYYRYMASKGDGPDAMAEEIQGTYLKTRLGTFEIDTIPRDNPCLPGGGDVIEISFRDKDTDDLASLLHMEIPRDEDEVYSLVTEYCDKGGYKSIESTSSYDDIVACNKKYHS